MRRKLICITLALVFVSTLAVPAWAHDYDRGDSDHWLRQLAYVVHPIGVALEYGVTRPIHWVVSRPNACIIFGHDPRPEDTYFVWK